VDMISLHDIQKSYGSHQVLKNVDLTVRQGEIYGLIEKNGAGKTTIFKIILGLTMFESGRLSIAGKSTKADLESGRKKIGFFIGKNFFDYLTAKENLDYYRQMKGIRDRGETERVLKLVGLDKSDAKFGSFSMGMKQRLGIANAMLGDPEILILDEPVNGLDPQGIADIRNLLTDMNREHGTTIIVSSHILGELEHTATRFGIIDRGRMLREITHEDLRVPKRVL
jgi:ABC-2 type transport system ATP-binding protein